MWVFSSTKTLTKKMSANSTLRKVSPLQHKFKNYRTVIYFTCCFLNCNSGFFTYKNTFECFWQLFFWTTHQNFWISVTVSLCRCFDLLTKIQKKKQASNFLSLIFGVKEKAKEDRQIKWNLYKKIQKIDQIRKNLKNNWSPNKKKNQYEKILKNSTPNLKKNIKK